MGVFQANIWKHSFFKGIGNLLSSPQKNIKCFLVSENGIGSIVTNGLGIGWCSNINEKMSWMVINKLRMPMDGVEGYVLPISERDYVPLDPLNRLKPEEKAVLTSLKDIAVAKRREARSRVTAENRTSANAEAVKTIAWIVGIVTVICVVVVLFKHH